VFHNGKGHAKMTDHVSPCVLPGLELPKVLGQGVSKCGELVFCHKLATVLFDKSKKTFAEVRKFL
jgi:hypothetical protein